MLGEPIVITGPPGAGKSTLSAALADLYEPSALVEGDAAFFNNTSDDARFRRA